MALGPSLKMYNVFSARDRTLHRARRQLIGQAITERSMRVFEPVMTKQINIFLRQLLLSTDNRNPVNMTEQMRRLGLDVAGLLAFGYDLSLQTEEENRFILTVLDLGTVASNVGLHFPAARTAKLTLAMMLPIFELREKYLNLMQKMISTRMAQDRDATHDIYSFVADVLDAKSGGLRQSELWAEANLFLTAGECHTYAVALACSGQ